MKCLLVCDKKNSAIWRLAQGIKKYLPHFKIDVIAVHPKRPDPDQLDAYNRLANQADIISYEYWKTALMLLDNYPNNKPKILCHYNPYNLQESDWKQFNIITVANQIMKQELKQSRLVPLSIDLELFPFQREYPETNQVLMVSSRIESKKGVLPVAEVCQELGYPLVVVGSISDRDYMNKILATGAEFREQVTDEELLKVYQESAIHICNSVDGYESGTLPVLEAMAVGAPVITRNVGHIPDLDNGFNMIIRKGQPEDKQDLKQVLKFLMEDRQKRLEIREDAWGTVKSWNDERRALEYEKMFWELYSEKPLVSIIIPTFNRKEQLAEIIGSIVIQDYKAKEIVICDDGSTDGTFELVVKLQDKINIPIKYCNTGTANEYNLAYARNLGVLEASGEILIFLDDRYKPKRDNFISVFVENLRPKVWLYGNKGRKKDFVENVSCIYRQELIDAGMFNQIIKLYGFQSQELRVRFRRQKFNLKYVENAEVETILNTKSKYTKKAEIVKSKNVLWKLGLNQ